MNSFDYLFILCLFVTESLNCHTELGSNYDGRYIRLLSESIRDKGVDIFTSGEEQNLFCVCKNDHWMTCHVFGPWDDFQGAIDALNRMMNPPFFTIAKLMGAGFGARPVLFAIPHCPDPVFAEIILVFGPPKSLQQKKKRDFDWTTDYVLPTDEAEINQNMWPSGYPDHFLPISLIDASCEDDEPECFVLMTTFKPLDIAWVLKGEEHLIAEGKKIKCMSQAGIARCSGSRSRHDPGRMRDPLRRTGNAILNMFEHYQAFVVIDDSAPCAAEFLGSSQGSSSQDPGPSNSHAEENPPPDFPPQILAPTASPAPLPPQQPVHSLISMFESLNTRDAPQSPFDMERHVQTTFLHRHHFLHLCSFFIFTLFFSWCFMTLHRPEVQDSSYFQFPEEA